MDESVLTKIKVDVKESMEKLESLEGALKSHYQYKRILEKKIIQHIGMEPFIDYLKRYLIKLIDNEVIKVRNLDFITVSKLSFNQLFGDGKGVIKRKYPLLYLIVEKSIEEVKKEIEFSTTDSIIENCRKSILNLESLKKPITLYINNVSRYYLKFVEENLIPSIGREEFSCYVDKYCEKLLEKNKINILSPTFKKLYEPLLGDMGQIYRMKERYPVFYLIISETINKYHHIEVSKQVEILKSKEKSKRKNLISKNNNSKEKKKSKSNDINIKLIKQKVEEINQLGESEFLDLCKELIEEFNNRRQRITKIEFLRLLLGIEGLIDSEISVSYSGKLKFKELFLDLIKEESIKQRKVLIGNNTKQLNYKSDLWVLFHLEGLSLRKKVFDFSFIKHAQLKKELKMYIKINYTNDGLDRLFHDFYNIKRGLKIIQDKFDVINLSKINKVHISFMIQFLEYNTDYSVLSIKNTITALSKLTEFLLSLDLYKAKPKENFFRIITINNASSMSKNTLYIPNEIIEQIEMHLEELSETHKLIFKIFSYTGLRANEVLRLQIDCCEESKVYPGYAQLKYIPHKILYSKKKRGLSNYNYLYIPTELYLEIKIFIENNKSTYSTYNTEYLFAQGTDTGLSIPIISGFCRAINRIIKKYSISNSSEELWHFTAKQNRKTIAVNLIENNATPQEVANQLGHLDTQTTEKYYIEVKKKKLAELNSEFFEKKFELRVGTENLNLYNEEERRKLFIDFCLNKRDVEFGVCTKHYSEGECGKRVGASNCAVCNKLCTGQKYLEKWVELRDSQLEIIDELLRVYRENNIQNYNDFVEYKKEITLLNRYNAVIEEIEKIK